MSRMSPVLCPDCNSASRSSCSVARKEIWRSTLISVWRRVAVRRPAAASCTAQHVVNAFQFNNVHASNSYRRVGSGDRRDFGSGRGGGAAGGGSSSGYEGGGHTLQAANSQGLKHPCKQSHLELGALCCPIGLVLRDAQLAAQAGQVRPHPVQESGVVDLHRERTTRAGV